MKTQRKKDKKKEKIKRWKR